MSSGGSSLKTLAGTLDRGLARLEEAGALLAFLSLLGFSALGMGIRLLGITVPDWIEPLCHRLVLWLGFLGACLAVRSRAHIKLDLSQTLLPAQAQASVALLIAPLSGLLCLVLAHASWGFVLEEKAADAGTLAGIPAWIYPLIIPVGFMLMGLHFLLAPWVAAAPMRFERIDDTSPGEAP